MNEHRATAMLTLLLSLCTFFASGLALLGVYVYRSHSVTRSLQAELAQRRDLQREILKQLPSDQCLFPHFKNSVAYVFNPFIGHATLWGAKGHAYPVNLMGLRGPAITPPARGRKRILLVGDSWYFGWQLREEEKLDSHLQRLLKDLPFDVLTVAIPGWNVQSEASFLRGNIRALHPDVILWEVCPNDIWDVGGVVPPATLSWDISPQTRDPDDNAFNSMGNPLPVLPAILARHKANLTLIDAVRKDFGVPVLATPVEIPPALWSFLAQQAGVDLPVHFVPDKFRWDIRARISDHDSHPTAWMNERLAVGYAARLSEMSLLPPIQTTPEQQQQLREWQAVNAPVKPGDLDRYLLEVAQTLPESYTTEADFRRIVAGYNQEGRLGRRGIVHLRVRERRSTVSVEFDAVPYDERFQRQVKMMVRDFEGRETVTTRSFSASAQRVSFSLPLPAGTSRYPVYELEWKFNYDDCDYPNRCFAARLPSFASH